MDIISCFCTMELIHCISPHWHSCWIIEHNEQCVLRSIFVEWLPRPGQTQVSLGMSGCPSLSRHKTNIQPSTDRELLSIFIIWYYTSRESLNFAGKSPKINVNMTRCQLASPVHEGGCARVYALELCQPDTKLLHWILTCLSVRALSVPISVYPSVRSPSLSS